MTKPASTTKKTRKQHTPEFRDEVLKLDERIGVAAAARELLPFDESGMYPRKTLCQPRNNADNGV